MTFNFTSLHSSTFAIIVIFLHFGAFTTASASSVVTATSSNGSERQLHNIVEKNDTLDLHSQERCYHFDLIIRNTFLIRGGADDGKRKSGRNNKNKGSLVYKEISTIESSIPPKMENNLFINSDQNDLKRRKDKDRNNEFVVGGGNINEKERLSNMESSSKEKMQKSNQRLSHILHSMVGLNRYPNYLSRWTLDDIDTLEHSLEKSLEEIRKQKEDIIKRRSGIKTMIEKMQSENFDVDLTILEVPKRWDEVQNNILHPQAANAIFRSSMFKKISNQKKDDNEGIFSIGDLVSGKIDVDLDMAVLEQWIDQEMFDVYSFPLLSDKFCDKVKTAIQKVVAFGERPEFKYLNVGNRVVDLDSIGLQWLNDLIFHLIIRPISRHLFMETESKDDLDWRQGYVAGYSSEPSSNKGAQRQRLVSHTDDSEVTLNLCLGNESLFEGGELEFRGLRGTLQEGESVGIYSPIQGTALLHAGRHLHEVTPITSGDRYSYIIWARSWKGIRTESCPCCWLNRRKGERCICGKALN